MWRNGDRETTRSLLQYRRGAPRVERTHKRKNWDERLQHRTEDYLTNWIWGNRKGGEEFKDNSEISSLADLIYRYAK